MESLLKVVGIEVKHSDKANCDFKIVTFSGVKYLGVGSTLREVKTNTQGTRNLWPDHQVEVDGKLQTIKGDVDYDTISNGDIFTGSIFSCNTTPYTLEGRQVNRYKCIVFENENPMIVAARNLRQQNAAPLDEDGNKFELIAQKKSAAAVVDEP